MRDGKGDEVGFNEHVESVRIVVCGSVTKCMALRNSVLNISEQWHKKINGYRSNGEHSCGVSLTPKILFL